MSAVERLCSDIDRLREKIASCQPLSDSAVSSLNTRREVKAQMENLKHLQSSLKQCQTALDTAIKHDEAIIGKLLACASQQNALLLECRTKLDSCRANQTTVALVKREALVVLANLPDMETKSVSNAPLPAAFDLFS